MITRVSDGVEDETRFCRDWPPETLRAKGGVHKVDLAMRNLVMQSTEAEHDQQRRNLSFWLAAPKTLNP